MPRVAEEPLVSIHLRLYESDLVVLRRLYSQTPGVNMAIRTIIRSFLRQVESTSAAKIDATAQQPLDLSLASLSPDLVAEAEPETTA